METVAADVADEVGRGEIVGGQLAGERNFFHEGLAVDREGEGAAHADVVEGFSLHVEAVEINPVVGIDADGVGLFALVNGEFGERDFVGDVELAGAEHPLLGVGEFDGEEMDLVDFYGGAVPVGGRAGGDDFLVGAPLFEEVGAVADEVFGA